MNTRPLRSGEDFEGKPCTKNMAWGPPKMYTRPLNLCAFFPAHHGYLNKVKKISAKWSHHSGREQNVGAAQHPFIRHVTLGCDTGFKVRPVQTNKGMGPPHKSILTTYVDHTAWQAVLLSWDHQNTQTAKVLYKHVFGPNFKLIPNYHQSWEVYCLLSM